MHSAEDSAEKQTATFVSSTNIHIYDVIQDRDMRRYFEFVLRPPVGYDPEFYRPANEILDHIEDLYAMVDENDDYGFFHPSKPEWLAIRAIQASYISQDAITQFLATKGWEFCGPDDDGVFKKEFRSMITSFNSWKKSQNDKPWSGTYIKNTIQSIYSASPDEDPATRKAYYYLRDVPPAGEVAP
jgi:hypothetical protein